MRASLLFAAWVAFLVAVALWRSVAGAGGFWGPDPIGWLLLALAVALYPLPAFLAAARRHRNTGAISAVNLLLGWSGIGWCVALGWSLTRATDRTLEERVRETGGRTQGG